MSMPFRARGSLLRALFTLVRVLAVAGAIGLASVAPSVASSPSRHSRAAHRGHRARRRRHRRRGRTATGKSSASPASPCPDANTSVTAASPQSMAGAVLCLVNLERLEHGLPPLKEQPQLENSAQQWTDWMVQADEFTHGSDFAGRIAAAGYDFQAAGENIATGAPTPAETVSAWMSSAEHCANILSPLYRDTGTGASPDAVRSWATLPGTWTEDFGLSMSQSAPSQNWGPADGCPYRDG